MIECKDRLDSVFSALSDHTRRSMLDQLKRQDLTVMQLADHYDMTFQAVSKHLKVLERANLITKEKSGRQYICHQNPEPLANAILWISQQHELWQHHFDSLDDFLQKQENEQSGK